TLTGSRGGLCFCCELAERFVVSFPPPSVAQRAVRCPGRAKKCRIQLTCCVFFAQLPQDRGERVLDLRSGRVARDTEQSIVVQRCRVHSDIPRFPEGSIALPHFAWGKGHCS